MHIPKTAGMSLQGLVRRRHKRSGSLALVYDQESVDRGFKDQPELETVMGHFRYGYHRFSKRSPRYFTFLRNPVDQVISHYFYSLEKPEKFIDLPSDISNVIDFAKSKYGYNLQTRFVSGLDDIEGRENEALELAKSHLDTKFEAVGITEEFDLSLLIFGKCLGWKIINYSKRNEGRVKKISEAVSELERSELSEILNPDIDLYNYGLEIFNKQLVNYPNLNIKLKLLKLGNRVYASFDPHYIWLKKRLGLTTKDLH